MEATKPVNTIVLDSGPMLKNDPPISSLLAKAQRLVTVPAVIAEIRDPSARTRIETTWMPFLDILSPDAQSIKIITDFARRTGDLAVLSKPDLDVLALAFELEEQKNGRANVRTFPGQQLRKGRPLGVWEGGANANPQDAYGGEPTKQDTLQRPDVPENPEAIKDDKPSEGTQELSEAIPSLQVSHDQTVTSKDKADHGGSDTEDSAPISNDSDSGSDGWITPTNIQRHQAKDQNAAIPISPTKPIDVACITSDFAMQNVLLSMNLNLLNASLQRVRNIKTFVLRCHACFEKTKDMKKQFCPRCGKPTLTRVSCSTNSKGEFKIHLKKNIQWNHRGDRYSIPKPVPGSANGKHSQGKGGGKGGWGQDLILAEDQKEYLRVTGGNSRKKEKDLMDQDYLPSILTGDRGRAGGRPKIGAGRNINSKKR